MPNPLQKLLALPNDSQVKAVAVAGLVAFVCALAVSVVSVVLKPYQLANMEAEKKAVILNIVSALPGLDKLLGEAGANAVEVHVVELASGVYADDRIDAASYDARAAAADPELSSLIAPDADLAGITRRENVAPVYLVRSRDDADHVVLVILPVYGQGYQSTLYGYLALRGDVTTIAALDFYEHGETPGLGAKLTDPDWLASWTGKWVRDDQGRIRIAVVKGAISADSANARFSVDGISGATRTSQGVEKLLRFWLGPQGFGPYLTRLQNGEV